MNNLLIIVNDDEFFQKTLLSIPADQPFLIYFTASWCGPCRRIGPVVQRLSEEHQLPVLKVDVDQCPDTASDYEVTAMPTFIFMKGKEILAEFCGANSQKLEELTITVLSK